MKKALSIILSLAMLFALCALPASAAFPDVPEDHPAQAAMERWSGYGLILGNEKGDFLPKESLTRGAMAVMLDRLMGYQVKAESTFADLKAGDWYYDAMLRLNAAKVLEGAGGKAMPEAEMTRQEAAALAARALGVEESTKALTFTDRAVVADWAVGSVAALAERGCFQGETAFRPTEKMTRAETVVMLDTLVAAFVNKDGEYSADAKGDVVVNAQNVTLKNMSITGNLIIADGVGDGDVFLDHVTVSGKIILRGGGANSFHLLPCTVVEGAIIVTKTASGGIRLVNESGKVLPMVNVADGKDGVTLEGKFTEIIVATDAPIALNNAEVSKTVSVTVPGANVAVTGASKVAKVEVAKTAEGTKLDIGENAKVTKVDVAANGLTMDNANKTSNPTVTVDKSVTEKPADSKGEAVKPSNPSGGSNVPSGPVTLTSIAANLASPQAAKTATAAVPASGGYTVTTTWSPALVENKFAKDTAYTATLVFSLASSSYVWGESAPAVAVNNSTAYGANATVGAPVLDKEAGTVTVTATYVETAAVLNIVIDAQPQNVSATVGNTSGKSLNVTAHTEADAQAAVNYPVSYQWYSADNAQMTGKTPAANAISARFHIPANLTEGTYYYACGLTADGVPEVMSTAAKVEVTAAVGGEVKITNLRFEMTDFVGIPQEVRLVWDFEDQSGIANNYKVCYYNGQTLVFEMNWGTDNEIGTEVDFQNCFVEQGITSASVNRVTLMPQNDNEEPLGPTVTLNCNLTITSGEKLPAVTPTYDDSTKSLTIHNIPVLNCVVNGVAKDGKYFLGRGFFGEGTDVVFSGDDLSDRDITLLKQADSKIVMSASTSTLTNSTTASIVIRMTDSEAIIFQQTGNE